MFLSPNLMALRHSVSARAVGGLMLGTDAGGLLGEGACFLGDWTAPLASKALGLELFCFSCSYTTVAGRVTPCLGSLAKHAIRLVHLNVAAVKEAGFSFLAGFAGLG